MSKHRYLVILRNDPSQPGQAGESGPSPGPSPEEMQKMFAAYTAWRERFKEQILDMGDKLGAEGRVVTASGVTDGPFVETKEVVGGFMIVSAENLEGAVEVVRACPAVEMPGVSLEIREMAGRSM
jgi:hypothetical protein